MPVPPLSMTANWKSSLRRRLLVWFGGQARDLPWRRTRDPYAVWISEVMLQQTQVATVVPYFERFLLRFPRVTDLAAASEQEVLRLWEGLGYYRRARQLHAAAKQIVAEHNGVFPTSPDRVRKLPGIGRYTMGAILSIALDQRLPILEANTIRLFSRLRAYRGAATNKAGEIFLWETAEALLPRTGCGTFNQALMELGALVCTPREPNCQACPLMSLCPTFANAWQGEIPAAGKRTQYETVRENAVVVERRGRFLARRCASGERWAGLWDFPRFAQASSSQPATREELATGLAAITGLRGSAFARIARWQHGVTRYRITLDVFRAQQVSGRLHASRGEFQWLSLDEFEHYPFSSTGRKIARLLLSNSVAADVV